MGMEIFKLFIVQQMCEGIVFSWAAWLILNQRSQSNTSSLKLIKRQQIDNVIMMIHNRLLILTFSAVLVYSDGFLPPEQLKSPDGSKHTVQTTGRWITNIKISSEGSQRCLSRWDHAATKLGRPPHRHFLPLYRNKAAIFEPWVCAVVIRGRSQGKFLHHSYIPLPNYELQSFFFCLFPAA